MDTIQHKHYGNIKVYDLDDDLLFIANNGKAAFYIKKGIADIIEGTKDNPIAIRLNFKTNGKGHCGDSPFYLTPRRDECVICSTSINLTRHHVVPYCYRRFMPEQWKSHDHHDVVLLCITCHIQTEKKYTKKKHDIINRLGLHRYNSPLEKAIKAAFALKTRSITIPDRRKIILTSILENYLQRPATPEDIDDICHKYHRTKRRGSDISKEIINRTDNLEAFIKEWRGFFVEECGAINLPSGWSIHTKPPEVRRRNSPEQPLF